MPKVDKRFTVLFSEEEILLLKEQARVRGISSGELVRSAVQNEITKKSNYDKIKALKKIHQLSQKFHENSKDATHKNLIQDIEKQNV